MQLQLIVILLSAASLNLVQSNQPQGNKRRASVATRASSSNQYLSLVNKLRSERATIKLTNARVQQPFFSVAGRIMNINDEGVQVFRYATDAAAANQAKQVAGDGMTIGTSKPSWMAPPHFFRSGKFIVLYVGTNESILKVLQTALGSQFAGS